MAKKWSKWTPEEKELLQKEIPSGKSVHKIIRSVASKTGRTKLTVSNMYYKLRDAKPAKEKPAKPTIKVRKWTEGELSIVRSSIQRGLPLHEALNHIKDATGRSANAVEIMYYRVKKKPSFAKATDGKTKPSTTPRTPAVVKEAKKNLKDAGASPAFQMTDKRRTRGILPQPLMRRFRLFWGVVDIQWTTFPKPNLAI